MSTTRHLVAQASSLGPLTEVKIGEKAILLAKHNDQIHALGAKCTHYGAPLKNGVLTKDGCLTCPWHGARFKVATGDIEDAPAIKALPSFKVEIEGDNVYVHGTEAELDAFDRDVCSVKDDTSSPSVVIVGGGAGGLCAAEGLRQAGFKGKVTMYTKEPNLPLDRTKLSKAFIGDAAKLEWFNKDELIEKLKVDVQHVEVEAVDKKAKIVKLANGIEAKYDKLVLATGAFPSKLPIPGAELENVFLLRNIEHVQAINKAIGTDKSKHLVILGGSFIGMEAATAMLSKTASVTVIEPAYPFKSVFGEKVAQRLVKLHEEKGVKFVLGQGSVKDFKAGQGGAVALANLENGDTLPADVVLLATGVKPQTQFLSSQLDVQKDGGLDIDEYARVAGEEDIYAIGDIARFKHPGTGTYGRIEHWNVAQNLGRTAGKHIAGQGEPFQKVPLFWSAQQGKQLRYAGHAEDFDDILYQGSVDDLAFAAYYAKGEKIMAVLTIGKDPIAAKSLELLRLGKMPTASEIKRVLFSKS